MSRVNFEKNNWVDDDDDEIMEVGQAARVIPIIDLSDDECESHSVEHLNQNELTEEQDGAEEKCDQMNNVKLTDYERDCGSLENLNDIQLGAEQDGLNAEEKSDKISNVENCGKMDGFKTKKKNGFHAKARGGKSGSLSRLSKRAKKMVSRALQRTRAKKMVFTVNSAPKINLKKPKPVPTVLSENQNTVKKVQVLDRCEEYRKSPEEQHASNGPSEDHPEAAKQMRVLDSFKENLKDTKEVCTIDISSKENRKTSKPKKRKVIFDEVIYKSSPNGADRSKTRVIYSPAVPLPVARPIVLPPTPPPSVRDGCSKSDEEAWMLQINEAAFPKSIIGKKDNASVFLNALIPNKFSLEVESGSIAELLEIFERFDDEPLFDQTKGQFILPKSTESGDLDLMKESAGQLANGNDEKDEEAVTLSIFAELSTPPPPPLPLPAGIECSEVPNVTPPTELMPQALSLAKRANKRSSSAGSCAPASYKRFKITPRRICEPRSQIISRLSERIAEIFSCIQVIGKNRENNESPMPDDLASQYKFLQQNAVAIIEAFAIFKQHFSTADEVTEFSKESGIPLNIITMVLTLCHKYKNKALIAEISCQAQKISSDENSARTDPVVATQGAQKPSPADFQDDVLQRLETLFRGDSTAPPSATCASAPCPPTLSSLPAASMPSIQEASPGACKSHLPPIRAPPAPPHVQVPASLPFIEAPPLLSPRREPPPPIQGAPNACLQGPPARSQFIRTPTHPSPLRAPASSSTDVSFQVPAPPPTKLSPTVSSFEVPPPQCAIPAPPPAAPVQASRSKMPAPWSYYDKFVFRLMLETRKMSLEDPQFLRFLRDMMSDLALSPHIRATPAPGAGTRQAPSCKTHYQLHLARTIAEEIQANRPLLPHFSALISSLLNGEPVTRHPQHGSQTTLPPAKRRHGQDVPQPQTILHPAQRRHGQDVPQPQTIHPAQRGNGQNVPQPHTTHHTAQRGNGQDVPQPQTTLHPAQRGNGQDAPQRHTTLHPAQRGNGLDVPQPQTTLHPTRRGNGEDAPQPHTTLHPAKRRYGQDGPQPHTTLHPAQRSNGQGVTQPHTNLHPAQRWHGQDVPQPHTTLHPAQRSNGQGVTQPFVAQTASAPVLREALNAQNCQVASNFGAGSHSTVPANQLPEQTSHAVFRTSQSSCQAMPPGQNPQAAAMNRPTVPLGQKPWANQHVTSTGLYSLQSTPTLQAGMRQLPQTVTQFLVPNHQAGLTQVVVQNYQAGLPQLPQTVAVQNNQAGVTQWPQTVAVQNNQAGVTQWPQTVAVQNNQVGVTQWPQTVAVQNNQAGVTQWPQTVAVQNNQAGVTQWPQTVAVQNNQAGATQAVAVHSYQAGATQAVAIKNYQAGLTQTVVVQNYPGGMTQTVAVQNFQAGVTQSPQTAVGQQSLHDVSRPVQLPPHPSRLPEKNLRAVRSANQTKSTDAPPQQGAYAAMQHPCPSSGNPQVNQQSHFAVRRTGETSFQVLPTGQNLQYHGLAPPPFTVNQTNNQSNNPLSWDFDLSRLN